MQFQKDLLESVRQMKAGQAARVTEAVRQQKPRMEIVRTGTDNIPFEINHEELDEPAVMRRGETVLTSMDHLEIPAFLRKQAD